MAKSRKSDQDTPEVVEEAVVVDDASVDAKDDDTAESGNDIPDAEPSDESAPEETSVEQSADDAPETKADPAPQPARQGTGFTGLLMGGALAAALGFGAARYPDQWPFASAPDIDPVQTALASLDKRVSGVESKSNENAGAVTALKTDDGLDRLRDEMGGQLDQMTARFEALSTKLTDLENRVHTVEKLPQGSGMEAAAAAATAYERELQQMRQMLDAELAKIGTAREDAKSLEVSAAETAKAAAARAAMSRVNAALQTGQAFEDALFDVTQNAGVEAPSILTENAREGVATLTALQESFPDVARRSLDASIRSAVGEGKMDRVTAFFRTQLGARSLSPKEGDDPDAILSRAEAALKDGRLAAALSELDTMPDAGKPALEAWVKQAKARHDALEAGQALAQQVNSN